MNLFAIDNLYATALVAGALSVDAAEGSASPFDARIHELRGHPGQIAAAAAYRELLAGSPINSSHRDCGKVQDPYSLRCQPQVMGACCDQIEAARAVLLREANGVTDNPLVFIERGRTRPRCSPAAISTPSRWRSPPTISRSRWPRSARCPSGASRCSSTPRCRACRRSSCRDGGVNSGFMIAHVTAAALASENKLLAHPASVDSLPTSANQEDHVSMATFAARKLGDLCENTAIILAIELLAAAQGVDLRAPHLTSERLQRVMREIRARVPHYDIDHYLAPDIAAMTEAVNGGVIAAHAPQVRRDADSGRVPALRRHVARRRPVPPAHAAVALLGLAAITAYKLLVRGLRRRSPGSLGLQWHLQDEWVILANLFALLVGFALLSRHFEQSHLPHLLPRILPDDWKGGLVLLALVFVLSAFLDNIAAAMIGATVAAHRLPQQAAHRLSRGHRRGVECRRRRAAWWATPPRR